MGNLIMLVECTVEIPEDCRIESIYPKSVYLYVKQLLMSMVTSHLHVTFHSNMHPENRCEATVSWNMFEIHNPPASVLFDAKQLQTELDLVESLHATLICRPDQAAALLSWSPALFLLIPDQRKGWHFGTSLATMCLPKSGRKPSMRPSLNSLPQRVRRPIPSS